MIILFIFPPETDITSPTAPTPIKPLAPQPAIRSLSPLPKPRKIRRKRRSPRKIKNFDAEDYEEELEKLKATGIRTKDHTRDLCRRMIQTTDLKHKVILAEMLKMADPPCRRLFIDYRGLYILGMCILYCIII